MKSGKPKKCRICKTEFQPFSTTQVVCSINCSLILVEQQKEKKSRIELREGRKKLKTLSEWHELTQPIFNEWIRLRDARERCISCSSWHVDQWHAGHYLSVGSHPELRYEEDNVHKQCLQCNHHKSGNIRFYRERLIEKIGIEKVEWLEGPHEPKKYTVDDLAEIRKKCRAMIKLLS